MRPLLDTGVDQKLYLKRAVHEQIERLLKRHNNVLIYGERGIGKTTLLRSLTYDLRSTGNDTLFIESRLAENTIELLDLISYRLMPTETVNRMEHALQAALLSNFSGSSVLQHTWQTKSQTGEILTRIETIEQHLKERKSLKPIFVLDEVSSSQIARELFGRFRDELWKLDATWLVASSQSELDGFLTPPADVFFTKKIEIKPLEKIEQFQLIVLRTDEEQPSKKDVQTTSTNTDLKSRIMRGLIPGLVAAGKFNQLYNSLPDEGNPRRLLVAANEVLDPTSNIQALDTSHKRLELLIKPLGEPAIQLSKQLEVLGPASASDPELQRRLGWTRPRVVQVLKQLEEAGVVRSFTRSAGPGAPRKLYRLVDSSELS